MVCWALAAVSALAATVALPRQLRFFSQAASFLAPICRIACGVW
jgi:hypothetical protein